ncbi:MAG: ATP-dependent DNA helicase RecG [Thermodesulfobacteriota bacterium]|nr:MAG: ATP-dependent DNA helicase RecG [Candidatus Dadabacteria bacterium]
MLASIQKMTNKSYNLDNKITVVSGVGPKIQQVFNSIGIYRIRDLLFYFPRRYKDYRETKEISKIAVNDEVTLKGKVTSSGLIRSKRKIYEVIISDETGQFKIIWFNPFYGYLKQNFQIGTTVVLSGKATKSNSSKFLQMVNPKPENIFFLPTDSGVSDFAKIAPIYPLTKGLTQNRLNMILNEIFINTSLKELDLFSQDVMDEYGLINISDSISRIHKPLNEDELVDLELSHSVGSSIYHKTIIFYEFLILCLGVKEKQKSKQVLIGKQHLVKSKDSFYSSLKENLPFILTSSQEQVLKEIIYDMRSKEQMNRLLQGDVGSGKTIVALLSMALSYDNGYQSTIIAPTEILADQHYLFLKKYVDINELVILKSSLSSEQRKEVLNKIASGSVKFIVGTHSLFQDRVVYENLGLIVIDEQHRFGVLQRKLMAEKGRSPDILIMTATPIPRTLSSIFFSDYSISRINMMPENRGKIETKISSLRSSDNAFDFAVNQLKEGRQAFVLCPLISKSENIEFESLADVESVYKDVAFNSFKDFKVEILHGKQKSSDKEKIMDKFRKKEIDVLVSTTVIEVGVDIPNANLMIIYNPERFGLSQLHQLRGRIGRGGYDSTCILMVDDINESSKERLSIFRDNLDGFVLSEKDMQIRGPGAFYGAGTEQSGRFWDLHLANLRRDFEILKEAKKCADNIESYKFYNDRISILEDLILDFWGDKLELTKTI